MRGFSIIEILIAIALMTIVISGVLVGSGGFASTIAGYGGTVSDSEINSEALRKAQELIEQAAATAREDYTDVVETSVTDISDGLEYLKKLLLPTAYATQCQQAVSGVVSWTGTHGRELNVAATTTIVDVPGMIALGGDCDITLPSG
jgi:prepilin-type N-terminal cleavage/methylation domain-containing protein